ncbi:MAG: DUF4282 domain-containing protein [Pseudomonadota bacterium]
MTELVGRLLSFEERNGRGLVRLVFYLLLFLLVVTNAWEMTKSFGGMGGAFWANLFRVLVTIPFTFLVQALVLRLGAEVIMALFDISENLKSNMPEGDIMSSGLNVGGPSPVDDASAPEPKPKQKEPDEKPSSDGIEAETTEKE